MSTWIFTSINCKQLQRTEHCISAGHLYQTFCPAPSTGTWVRRSAHWPHADRLHFFLVSLTFCIADGLFIVLFCIQKFYFHIEATSFLSNTGFLLYIYFWGTSTTRFSLPNQNTIGEYIVLRGFLSPTGLPVFMRLFLNDSRSLLPRLDKDNKWKETRSWIINLAFRWIKTY